jgi:1-phosphofructokinase
VEVTRAEHPALEHPDDTIATVEVPTFEPLDHRGAGDSMTAGIAAGLAEGASLADAIRLGAAAGTLNVTRRGLASGERSAIQQLAERVVLRSLESVDAPPPPPTMTPEALAARVGPK